MNNISTQPNRRDFLKTSGAAIVSGAVLAPYLISSAHAAGTDAKLKIGFIGCGGRGTGAAGEALNADKNTELYAMGDIFPEKIQNSLNALKSHGEQINCPPERQFVGLDAYQKVIDSGVDVVLLTTPPGFRPMHFKAAVAANKHCFLEKPMATDAPGVRSVMESVKIAKEKKLAVVAGYCWRYDFARRELYKRIHDGEIGDIRAVYGCYFAGPVKPMPAAATRKEGMGDVEWTLRNWYNFVWLSGDSLVEQAVHSVDKVAWAMKDVPPLKCVAVGGRQAPNPGGNIFDHFEVNYEYANGVRAFLGSRQQGRCYSKVADYIMGTKGIGTIGDGPLGITGEKPWTYEGKSNNMYQTEHDELFASLRAGTPINDGDRMCTSTMLAIMGRMAAYTGQQITWQQALESKESLVPEKLEWNQKLEATPMPIPGVTPFV